MNGWKNYETWNVALWIRNDEALYHTARSCKDYGEFVDKLESWGEKYTGDKVYYKDDRVCRVSMDEVIAEISVD
jgi:hypothetical protein